jgi:hypothetical protein
MLIFILFIAIIIGGVLWLSKPSFEVRKSRLINLYSSVLSDMNMDFRDNTIWAVNITNITGSIRYFADEVNQLQTLVLKQNQENQKWLIDLMQEFTTNLHLWIERHASELQILDSTIQTIETSDIWEQSALELASKRLESHIQLLEKI